MCMDVCFKCLISLTDRFTHLANKELKKRKVHSAVMGMILFIVCIFSVCTFSLCDINVALGKPAKQSSVAPDLMFATANKAVDGNDDNQESISENSCIHTSYQGNPKTAWWQVDLLKPYQIDNIEIVYRDWRNIELMSVGRLAGFSVSVSNISTGWLHSPSERCFHWRNISLPNLRASYPCKAFGRYVTIYNERNGSEPSWYSPNAVLELCEIKIQVPGNCHNCEGHCSGNKCFKCDVGYYGENCERYCKFCNDGISCDKITGECSDGRCRDGYYKEGIKCIQCGSRCRKCTSYTQCQACYSPATGQDCSSRCDGCGGDRSCSHTTKVCSNNCSDSELCHTCPPSCDILGCTYKEGIASCTKCGSNTYDIDCKPCPTGCSKCQAPDAYCTHCLDGYHGFQCTNTCPAGCKNSSSDDACTKHLNGTATCTHGCTSHHYGTDCKPCNENCIICSPNDGSCSECKNGFYGTICNSACPSSCGGNKSCSDTGGRIICNEGCDQHYFGDDCSMRCSITCLQQICNTKSGKCDKCIYNRYGDRCELYCGKCLNDAQCLQNNGSCNAGCADGYYGDKCSDICPNTCGSANKACEQLSGMCKECPSKMYGSDCTNKCSENCAVDGACYINNGTCKHSCTSGYIGHDCKFRVCVNPKMWGPNCNLTCSSTCKDKGHCDTHTGMCLDGCVPGYFGSNCSTHCEQNCAGEKRDCSRESGRCLYGCKDGWTDPNCLTTKKNTSVFGAAVGGAVAGFFVIAFLVIIFLIIRRRRLLSIERKSLYDTVTFDAAVKHENNYDQINRAPTPGYVQKDVTMPVEKPKEVKTKRKQTLKPESRKASNVTYYNSDNNEYYNTICTPGSSPPDDSRTFVAKSEDNQMLNTEYDEI